MGISLAAIAIIAIAFGTIIGHERGVFLGIIAGCSSLAVLSIIWIFAVIKAAFTADEIDGAGGLCLYLRNILVPEEQNIKETIAYAGSAIFAFLFFIKLFVALMSHNMNVIVLIGYAIAALALYNLSERWSDDYDPDGDATAIESFFAFGMGYLVVLFVFLRDHKDQGIGWALFGGSLIATVMLRHFSSEEINPALLYATYAILITSFAYLLSSCVKKS